MPVAYLRQLAYLWPGMPTLRPLPGASVGIKHGCEDVELLGYDLTSVLCLK